MYVKTLEYNIAQKTQTFKYLQQKRLKISMCPSKCEKAGLTQRKLKKTKKETKVRTEIMNHNTRNAGGWTNSF